MMALLRDRKSRGKEILRRVEGEAKMIMKIGRKRERGEVMLVVGEQDRE